MKLPPACRTSAIAAALALIILSSCRAPSGGPGRRSAYGDRPGPRGFTTVVLDAGHGGKDSGTRGRGAFSPEKTLALDLARRVESQLRGAFKTVLTRRADVFIPLDDRVRLADRAGGDAVLVSIHLNEGARRIAGPETFYWRVDSYSLARRVQQRLAAVAPYEYGNRGLVRRRLRLTRNPQIPCILVECAYLSNRAEQSLLRTTSYRDQLARAIAAAIRDQAALGDAGMGPLPRPIYAPISRSTDPRE
jgi:N-acetylmuramoyl-L-alanine amidase